MALLILNYIVILSLVVSC